MICDLKINKCQDTYHFTFNSLKISNDFTLKGNLKKGVNVIVHDDSKQQTEFIDQISIKVRQFQEKFNLDYSNSLFTNSNNNKVISKYSKIIDLNTNLTFRRLYNSLIITHKNYLIEKYQNFNKFKNFILFPGGDQNFICFLYSLTIIKDLAQEKIPIINDFFFNFFDYLTLTSTCKLLLDEVHIKELIQFITFEIQDSYFMKEYSKFYDFNYIKINNLK